MSAILHSFEKNDELNSFVDNLSGGNIRRALDFLNAFIGSGHVNATRILANQQEQGFYMISVHEFMRAVIFGDNEHYDPSTFPIANLFDISTPDARAFPTRQHHRIHRKKWHWNGPWLRGCAAGIPFCPEPGVQPCAGEFRNSSRNREKARRARTDRRSRHGLLSQGSSGRLGTLNQG
jgi:hypothetical protein